MNKKWFPKIRPATFMVMLIFVLPINAQTPNLSVGNKTESKKAGPALTPEQQRGLENLDRIALEARQIDNPLIRTDLQAMIADALWDFDKTQAKRIFLDAFKNARTLEDKADARAVQTRVVKHVWGRDHAFAEELMKQLSVPDEKESSSATDYSVKAQFGMQSADPTNQQKLDLARNLIQEDPAAAADLISNSLKREVNFTGIALLIRLKGADPATANMIFEQSLRQLPLLSPPVSIITALAMESYVTSECMICSPQNFHPPLADSYYRIALDVLRHSLGQTITPPAIKPELQARVAQFFHQMQAMLALKLGRLAPPENLPELQAIYQRQLKLVDARTREMLQAIEKMQMVSNKFDELFKAAESLPDAAQRDAALATTVELALKQDPDEELFKALEEKTEKIESKPLHDKAWSLLKAREVEKLIQSDSFDAAHTLCLKLPDSMVRARSLRELAIAVSGRGSQTLRYSDLLGEALDSVEKTDASIERSRLMFKITNDLVNLKEFDRAFEALQSSSSSLGTLEKSDFEQSNSATVPNSLFDYTGTFGKLGNLDFEKTMFLAQTIKWREFRLAAEIATCRSVLKRKG